MEMIKAYPLIYSRTKQVDFVPDFLARPEDLDYQKANHYIKSAMKNVERVSDVRHVVFSVNEQYVCVGVSGTTAIIAEKINRRIVDEEYLKDINGRIINAFLGVAVHKNDWREGYVPEISLEKYWEIYLNYLKKQWEAVTTFSDKQSTPEIDLEAVVAVNFHPEVSDGAGKQFMENTYFSCHVQEVIRYYMDGVKHDETLSFLSGIEQDYDLEDCIFRVVSVPAGLIKKDDGLPGTCQGASLSVGKPTSNIRTQIHTMVSTGTRQEENTYRVRQNTEKKTFPVQPAVAIIAIVILCLLVGILLL